METRKDGETANLIEGNKDRTRGGREIGEAERQRDSCYGNRKTDIRTY